MGRRTEVSRGDAEENAGENLDWIYRMNRMAKKKACPVRDGAFREEVAPAPFNHLPSLPHILFILSKIPFPCII
jgi:hypothetical protein